MFSQRLQELYQQRLNRVIKDRASGQNAKIWVDGRELINFASNDYLGLANHPEIVKAAAESMKEFGFGSGASRLLGGGSVPHRDLEQKISQFKGTEAALIFNTGYAANTGIIPAVSGEGDVIFSDELNHASIIDGCRLSRAKTVVYRHRDVAHLAALMKKKEGKRTMVVTDTVFSMDGDTAPLRDIYDLCFSLNSELSTPNSLLLYLDDAHGTGVIGNGRGALAHFALKPQPWIIQIGTCSKALGSFGAFVAGNRDVIQWIINTARSFIFSTAIPACAVAASLKALDLIEQGPELIPRLWRNRNMLVDALKGMGFDTGESETPIIPLKTGSVDEALNLSQYLYERGIYVPAIRPPTVKEPRVRLTVTAAHTEEDISSLIRALSDYE
ncbi:MAG: 8-amino-7-oxononanoate synthase [Nitrospirae bacterium]|nr:8-amino-7-oxononanoate synthase [Nitrospirota bacterium]